MNVLGCELCVWWDCAHPRLDHAPQVPGINKPGFCRKHKPGAYSLNTFLIGIQPIMDANDFCAEHRGDR